MGMQQINPHVFTILGYYNCVYTTDESTCFDNSWVEIVRAFAFAFVFLLVLKLHGYSV